MRRHDYFFQGMYKKDLAYEIRQIINQYELGQEFNFPLLSELLFEKHFYCAKHKLWPTMFRKIAHPHNEHTLEGFFPAFGWHRISWYGCIYPKSWKTLLDKTLRKAIHPTIMAYKQQHPVCERCGSNQSEEVDHIAPQFNDLLKDAMKLITQGEMERLLEDYNWWEKQSFELPENNLALKYVLSTHEHVAVQALCKKCHVAVTLSRRMLPENLQSTA